MLVWMAYACLVGALFAGAAHLADQGVRGTELPSRWLWAGALVAATMAPWAIPALVPPGPDVTLGAMAPVESPTADLGPSAAPPVPAWRRLAAAAGPVAGVLWLSTSAALVLLLGLSAVRLHLALRRCPLELRDGLRVRTGAPLGPAVAGLLRPVVLLPAWVSCVAPEDARLILAHEREHLRAGDNRLVFAAWLLVAALPFSPASWVLFGRLRAAVERDCDRRVLRGRSWPEQRRYGELLVDVGRRMGTVSHLPTPAAFAESGSHLERRIRSMYRLDRTPTRARLAATLAAGLLLLAGACMVPGPDAPTLTAPELEDAPPAAPVGTATGAQGPEFTPFTKAPTLLNRDEVAAAVAAEYPPVLRDAGIGGQVRAWLYVDESGRVTDLRLDGSSGHGALDAAALRVAAEMRFSPALNGADPVAAWIAMPLTFGRPPAPTPATDEDGPPAPPVDRAQLEREPTFTPYTVAPDLVNRSEVGQALEANYPAELRSAGIGGTARVWFLIDETGAVADTRLQESSGHEAIDGAALRVARTMEFTPALNRDRAVPVWVAFPITFMAR